MINISKRLAAIASLVPLNSSIVDIGCDHALFDIYLYQKGVTKDIIATDVNANALDNAKKNLHKYKLDNVISLRLGNGLDTINKEDTIDTIVISGMGAHTIVGILKNNREKLENIDTIIIQSNTKLEFLRTQIAKLNYIILDEKLVEDNKKIYTIIKFIKGKKHYTRKELYFGPILLNKKSALFVRNCQKELSKLNIYLKLIPKDKIIARYKVKKEISLYKDVVSK